MVNEALLEQRLTEEEGLKFFPYRDTVGKLTIGVGRNLDDVGVSKAEAMVLLANDVARTQATLSADHPWFSTLDPVRQEALADMAFNLGEAHLDTFAVTLAALQAGRYDAAADAMLQSQWATQVGQRARSLAQMVRTGAGG